MNDIIKRLTDEASFFNVPSIFDEAFFTKPLKGSLFSTDGFPFDITVHKDKKGNPIETRLVFACAGISKDNVNVTIEPKHGNNYLVVSISSGPDLKQEHVEYVHKGLSHRAMKKSFLLRDCDQKGISSEMKDGLLTIIIPMKQGYQDITVIDIK